MIDCIAHSCSFEVQNPEHCQWLGLLEHVILHVGWKLPWLASHDVASKRLQSIKLYKG
jgi:hypothetical protein